MIPLHEIVLNEDGALSNEQHDLQLHLLWCVSEHALINITVSAVEKESNSETNSVANSEEERSVDLNHAPTGGGSNISSQGSSNSLLMMGKKPVGKGAVPPIIESDESKYDDGELSGIHGNGSGSKGRDIPSNKPPPAAPWTSPTTKNVPSFQDKNPMSGSGSQISRESPAPSGRDSPSTAGYTNTHYNYASNSTHPTASTSSHTTTSTHTSLNTNSKPPVVPPSGKTAGATINRFAENNSSKTFTAPNAHKILSADDKKFESSALYTEMKQKIENLETALLASEEIVMFERTKTLETINNLTQNNNKTSQSTTIGYVSQINDLKTQLANSQAENQKLKDLFQEFSINNNKSSDQMGRLQNQLAKCTDEIDRLHVEKVDLETAIEDLKRDNESILADLITAKMTNGNVANELEEANLEIHNLKIKIEKMRRPSGAGPGAGGPQAGGTKVNLDQRLAEHQQQQRSMQTPQRPANNNNSAPQTAPSNRSAGNMSNGNGDWSGKQQRQQQQQNGAPPAPQSAAPKSNPFSGVNTSLLRGFDNLKDQFNTATAGSAGGGGNNKAPANSGMMRGFNSNPPAQSGNQPPQQQQQQSMQQQAQARKNYQDEYY
eukprot:gene26623-33230_t